MARDSVLVRLAARMIQLRGTAFAREYGDEMLQMMRHRLEHAPKRRAVFEFIDVTRAVITTRVYRYAAPPTRKSNLMLKQHARYAMRTLAGRPLFSATVILTLALGIASNVTMFSVLNAVFWRALPFADSERVALLWGWGPELGLGFPEIPLNGRDVMAYREHAHVLASAGAFKADLFNVTSNGATDRIEGIRATGGFFEALGVHPYRGNFFGVSEERPGEDHVAVISYDLWRSRFGGDEAIVGKSVRLNGEPYKVIAIAPQGFDFPRGGEMPRNFQFATRSQLWVPMAPPMSGPSELAVVARLKPGTTLSVAQADVDAARRGAEAAAGYQSGYGTRLVPIRDQMISGSRTTLLLLFGAVVLVMLIACANAAQLLLANVVNRRKEFAVRGALGATRGSLLSLLLTETVFLAGAAGLLGAALAVLGVRLVRAFGPARLPRISEVTINAPVLLFTLALVALTALIFGVVPALLGSRTSMEATMRAGGRTMSGGIPSRLRRTLVVAEIALSLVLIAGAGLLLRSLAEQHRLDPGFQADHALSFEVTLPNTTYHEARSRTERTYLDNQEVVAFHERALAQVRQLPGVSFASLAKPLPLSGAQEATVYLVEGRPAPTKSEEYPIAEYSVIGSDYFRTMGSSIRGREFRESDNATSSQVVIINESFARQWWPGQDAVGKRIKLPPPNRPWMTIIGVVPDSKQVAITEDARPIMYVPFTQRPYPTLSSTSFVVRTTALPSDVIPALRGAIAQLDAGVPIANVTTMKGLVARATAEALFASSLVTAFGFAATALAALGLWGLTAYFVSLRRRELGLRVALGATSRQLVTLVLQDSMKLVVIGCVLGLVGTIAAGRLVQSLLFGVSAYDPFTMITAPLLLIGISVIACLVPALRALRIHPQTALTD